MGDPISGAYKSLIGTLDQDLGNVSEGGFSEAYQKARANHAEMAGMFENPTINGFFQRTIQNRL